MTIRPGRLSCLLGWFAALVCSCAAHGQDAVVVRAQASQDKVSPGDNLVVAVIIEHAEHFHTWPAAAQDVLPPEISEFAFRTEVAIGSRPEKVVRVGPVQWPQPTPAKVSNPSGGDPVTVPLYQGRAIAYVPLVIAPDAAGQEVALHIEVSYQACDESICLIPRTDEFEIALPLVSVGTPREVVDDPAIFGGFDATTFASAASWSDGGADGDAASADGSGAAARPKFLGLVEVPRADSAAGIVIVSLLGVLGGLVLNLTPCVLPVIPIKVMTISQHAGTPAKALYLGTWMALGVIAFWVAAGLPVVLLATFTDPSRIFGIWWVTAGIGALIGLMALGLMGLFTFNLPQSVYMINPTADSAGGSFLFGLMTAVLGLPCFGFVAGALLPATAGAPGAVTMAVFTSLGVGMALPYLVLSARPSLIDRIPRTGPASELVKQVMGLLLLAAACYFLGSGILAFLGGRPAALAALPWWGKMVHWWLVAVFALAAGGWLAWRTLRITRRPGRRLLFAAVGAVIGLVAAAYVADTTVKAADDFWIPFDESVLVDAEEAGRVVVLDFTAEWCLNCKALKAAVLNREPVKSRLRGAGVVPLVADLTSTEAPGWEKLSDLGQTGIPLLAIYGPGVQSPILLNAYTPQMVLDAIDRAGG